MKISQLNLSGFKGATAVSLVANGGNVNVYGANESGKTTLVDGYLWTLTGRDSRNQADFDIKTVVNGEPIHKRDHSVEIVGDDGTSLKKTYREVWKREKGSQDDKFSGHENEYRIDGVASTERDFKAKVASICGDEKLIPLLTIPGYACDVLPWKELRARLIEVCGDVSDTDVIASNSLLADLPKILGSKTIDQYREIIKERKKAINKDLGETRTRIDEASRSIPNSPENPKSFYESEDARLRSILAGYQSSRAEIVSGGAVSAKSNDIRTIEGLMIDRANELKSMTVDNGADARKAKAEKTDELSNATFSVSSIRRRIDSLNADISRTEPRLIQLRNEMDAEKAKSPNVVDKCPTCGTALDPEKVEAAIAEFNTAKADRIAAILAQGKGLRADQDRLGHEVAQLTKELETATELVTRLQSELAGITIPAPTVVSVETDTRYQELAKDKAQLESELAELRTSSASAVAEVDSLISAVNAQINDNTNILAVFTARDRALVRIAELQETEKVASSEYTKLDHHQHLTEVFIRTKVKMLTDRINAKFKLTRWTLFEEQVNGALNEVCIATYKGVPWRSLNNAATVNVGLDIINTFSDHYGVTMPVFVDNAESVSEIIETRGQQIRLIVSKDDTTLRFEPAN